jgi:hypothetical protein
MKLDDIAKFTAFLTTLALLCALIFTQGYFSVVSASLMQILSISDIFALTAGKMPIFLILCLPVVAVYNVGAKLVSVERNLTPSVRASTLTMELLLIFLIVICFGIIIAIPRLNDFAGIINVPNIGDYTIWLMIGMFSTTVILLIFYNFLPGGNIGPVRLQLSIIFAVLLFVFINGIMFGLAQNAQVSHDEVNVVDGKMKFCGTIIYTGEKSIILRRPSRGFRVFRWDRVSYVQKGGVACPYLIKK